MLSISSFNVLICPLLITIGIIGLGASQEITLVKKVQYAGSLVEEAWPLGSVIEVILLLVLDSMWQPNMSQDEIGIPELVGGRKLMLTCRMNTVCSRTAKYEIQALSSVDEAWELFKIEMGSSLPHYLEEETASSIKRASLAELDGLPLAISKLAHILGNKQEQQNPAELNRAWRKELAGFVKKPFCYVECKGFKDSYEDLEEAIKPCVDIAILSPFLMD